MSWGAEGCARARPPRSGDGKVQTRRSKGKGVAGRERGRERETKPKPSRLGQKPDHNHDSGQALHLHPTQSSRHVPASTPADPSPLPGAGENSPGQQHRVPASAGHPRPGLPLTPGGSGHDHCHDFPQPIPLGSSPSRDKRGQSQHLHPNTPRFPVQ